MKPTLSPKELAEAVGVSESSLKRWADDGRIRAIRTAGGHRRIPVQEAIRFARQAKMQIVRPDLLGIPGLAPDTDRSQRRDPAAALHDKLAQGDTLAAQAILIDRYLAGQSIASLCDGMIRDAMTRIGETWQHQDDGIFVEHRATDICVQALSVLRSLIAQPRLADTLDPEADDRPVALGAAPAGDPYLIPSLMCAAVLADQGYRTINIGPNTPLQTLRVAAREHHPRLVWLACASHEATPDAGELHALARELAQTHTTLALGGRALRDVPLAPDQNLVHCRTMGELEKLAQGLRSR